MNPNLDPQENAPDPDKRPPDFDELAAEVRRNIGSRVVLEWELAEKFAARGLLGVKGDSEKHIRKALVGFVESQFLDPSPLVVYKSDVPLLFEDQQSGDVHFFLDIAAIEAKRFLLPGCPTDRFLQAEDGIEAASIFGRALRMPRYMYLDHALGVVGRAEREADVSSIEHFSSDNIRLHAVFSAAAVQAMMEDLTKIEEEFHSQRDGSNHLAVFAPSVSSYLLGALFHEVELNSNGLIVAWNDFRVRDGETIDFALTVSPDFSPTPQGPMPNFVPDMEQSFAESLLSFNQDVQKYSARPRAIEGGFIDLGLTRVA